MAGNSQNLPFNAARNGERGSATTKFVMVVVALFLVGYGGFNYISTWYQITHFKDAMNEIIMQAYGMPNVPTSTPEAIRAKLRRIGDEDGVPPEAVMKIERVTGGVTAQVNFSREISILPFNMYKYKYEFNHTAAPPTGYLTK